MKHIGVWSAEGAHRLRAPSAVARDAVHVPYVHRPAAGAGRGELVLNEIAMNRKLNEGARRVIATYSSFTALSANYDLLPREERYGVA